MANGPSAVLMTSRSPDSIGGRHGLEHRHISRQGSPALRWALLEAAQKCTTGGGPLRESFERIAKRRGRKIAKVAVARQILTLSYYGLRDGEIRCLARRSRASAKEKLAVAP
jgi:hypothetical protein